MKLRLSLIILVVALLAQAPILLPAVWAWPEATERPDAAFFALINSPARKVPADADELTKLLIERSNAAREEVQLHLKRLKEDHHTPYAGWLDEPIGRFLDAELEVMSQREERFALLEGHVAFLKEAEEYYRTCHLAGGAHGIRLQDVAKARFYRLEAEIRLLKARREPVIVRPERHEKANLKVGESLGGNPAADSDILTKLRIERSNAAELEVKLKVTLRSESIPDFDDYFREALKRRLDAKLDLTSKREERLTLLGEYIDYLRSAEKLAMNRLGTSDAKVLRVKNYRLDAEVQLLRAKLTKKN